jgi:glycosyltransferase involved in cell wall biosynthesis
MASEQTSTSGPRRRVSVISPCRNERNHISRFLDSLLLQQFPDGVECEFLIADGMSNDGTREILAQYKPRFHQLLIVDNVHRHVSTGLNQAIQMASGDVIIRMDVHTEYAPDYIRECLVALEATGADNVGGPAVTKSEGFMQRAISLAYVSPFGCGGAQFHDPYYEGWVDTVTYGCWRKETLFRLGLFDEQFVRNQDDELNLRIRRSGGRIWQTPRIRSWYKPRESLSALFRQYFQYGYWKVRVLRKHKIPASGRHLVPGLFVGTVLLLSALAPFNSLATRLWLAEVGVYLAASAAASLHACAKTGHWTQLPVLPFVFAAYHVSYGLGFLRGLVDVSFGRSPSRSVSALSR